MTEPFTIHSTVTLILFSITANFVKHKSLREVLKAIKSRAKRIDTTFSRIFSWNYKNMVEELLKITKTKNY